MKKILKTIKEISKHYKCYRLIITSNHCEVKFTPKNDSDSETVFCTADSVLENEFSRIVLLHDLEEHLRELQQETD